MKKNEVEIGKTYVVKVSGHLVPVKLTRSADPALGGWYGTNTVTGREVRIRTAGKLRREYHAPQPLFAVGQTAWLTESTKRVAAENAVKNIGGISSLAGLDSGVVAEVRKGIMTRQEIRLEGQTQFFSYSNFQVSAPGESSQAR